MNALQEIEATNGLAISTFIYKLHNFYNSPAIKIDLVGPIDYIASRFHNNILATKDILEIAGQIYQSFEDI